MRVLVLTQYIYPETFKSTDLVFELAKRGYSVDVLTGIPNYPEGHYFEGYGLFKKRIEKVNGVRFYRCFQTPRKLLPSLLGLSLNYLTFMVSAYFWVLFFFAWKKKYDAIITHEPSPITQILPAILLGKLKGAKVYSWIMDIWPDSVTDVLDGKKAMYIVPFLKWITNKVYKGSDKLLITSKGFEELINRDADYSDKIIYYPNWSEDILNMDSSYETPSVPEGFVIMLAGNIGEAQNLEAVGEAMKLTHENKTIKWVFVGDGSKKQWLDSFIEQNCLKDTAVTFGRFPFKAMPAFFKKASAMLVSLAPGFKFLDVTVPARLQSYMSAGRPVLAMLGTGGAEIINESDCGYAVAPGDYKALVDVINESVLTDLEGFEKKGKNGRKFYEKEFDMGVCIDHLEAIIKG